MKKSTFSAFSFLSAASLSLAMLTSPVMADDDQAFEQIEIHAEKDHDVKIMVVVDGEREKIVLTQEELEDEVLLEQKLAGLDAEVREQVMHAVSSMQSVHAKHIRIKSDGGDQEWVSKVKTSGDGHVVVIDADMDIEDLDDGNEMIRRVIKMTTDGGDEEHFAFSFGGDHGGMADAIVRMLNSGEFTRDELDQIQQALDAKR